MLLLIGKLKRPLAPALPVKLLLPLPEDELPPDKPFSKSPMLSAKIGFAGLNVFAFANDTESNEQPAKITTISNFEIFIMPFVWV